MKIGILQTGHAPDAIIGETGDYDQLFERLLGGHGFDFETWAVVDNVPLPGPEAADGWLDYFERADAQHEVVRLA